MKKLIAAFAAVLSLIGARTFAQEAGPGPGTLEVTLIPGGGMFFVDSSRESGFLNYSLGGAATYNINQYVGIEGEIASALGITQNVLMPGVTSDHKTPNALTCTGNVVFSAPAHYSTVMYAAAGLGGLTMFQNMGLDVTTTTFLTSNAGGGIKWYVSRIFGFRADYRFLMVKSTAAAPAFFGQDNRYGYRVYGALVLNVVP